MKRRHFPFWTAAALLAAALLVSGCSGAQQRKKQAAAQYTGAFSCTVTVAANGQNYTAQLSRAAAGTFRLQLVKPAALSPLSFTLAGQKLTVQYGPLSTEVDPSGLPQTAMAQALFHVFGSVADGSVKSAATRDGGTALSGQTPSGRFSLILGADYKPRSLTLEELQMSVRFSDFAFGAAASAVSAAGASSASAA